MRTKCGTRKTGLFCRDACLPAPKSCAALERAGDTSESARRDGSAPTRRKGSGQELATLDRLYQDAEQRRASRRPALAARRVTMCTTKIMHDCHLAYNIYITCARTRLFFRAATGACKISNGGRCAGRPRGYLPSESCVLTVGIGAPPLRLAAVPALRLALSPQSATNE